MLLKCCTQNASKFGKLSRGHSTGKVLFHSCPKEKQCQRRLKLYCTIVIISHASKVMLKILQARLQPYMNHELQMFKLVFEKAEIKLPTSVGS